MAIGASAFSCFVSQTQLPQFLIAWTAHRHLGPLALIALILAHIYIGTLGMEGALRDTTDGQVDENWTAEHHALWLDRLKNAPPSSPRNSVAPTVLRRRHLPRGKRARRKSRAWPSGEAHSHRRMTAPSEDERKESGRGFGHA